MLGNNAGMENGYFSNESTLTFNLSETNNVNNAVIIEPREKTFSLTSSHSVVDLLFSTPKVGTEEKLSCFESEKGELLSRFNEAPVCQDDRSHKCCLVCSRQAS